MTNTHIQLYAHQIGMVRAARETTPQARIDYRSHQQAAHALRATAGPIYQPYPHRNRALVKALYTSLREHLITRDEFSACLQNVMGEHR